MTQVNGCLSDSKLKQRPVAGNGAATRSPMHRLSTVRQREGVSRRSMARRLGVSISDVTSQENETADLSLSTLRRWGEVLKVPLNELLSEPEDGLPQNLQIRARLVRVMKTAKAILEKTDQLEVQRMATMLVDQLVDAVPELRSISAWHSVGQRRTEDEVGRIAMQRFSDDLFARAEDYDTV